MPIFYLHLLLGGAFVAVWMFIAAMLFRDRLQEIRRDRQSHAGHELAPPHYLNRREKPHAARVA